VAIIAQRYVNNTQIFRNSWAVTKTAAAIPQIAGSGYVSESKQDCAALHAMAIEKALFFGQKFMGTRNGQPFHTMEGIIARVECCCFRQRHHSRCYHELDPARKQLWTRRWKLLPIRRAATSAPCSLAVLLVASFITLRVLNSTYQITTAETGWGLQIDTIRTPRGTFEMIEHPLFNAYGSASTWAKMAVIVDLNAFSLAYLRKTSDASYNSAGALVDTVLMLKAARSPLS